MTISAKPVICRFSTVLSFLLLTVNASHADTFQKCGLAPSNEHCFSFWIAENGTAYQGLVKNGLLDRLGMAVYPDGAFYIGKFKDGRRHGLGIWSTNDVAGWEGYFSIGYQSNDIRYGTNLYVWKNGRLWLGLDTGETNEKNTVDVSLFTEWRDAFNSYGLPQRKYIQTTLSNSYLKADLPVYSGKIDGAWGVKTFTALAIYAALKGDEFFQLQSYSAAQNTIRSIMRNDFDNFPFGYFVIDDPILPDQKATIPGCPNDPTSVNYVCFGSHKFASGEIYNGTWNNAQPNGNGHLILPNGASVEGGFVDGAPSGPVRVRDENGHVLFEGDWEDFLDDTPPDSPNTQETLPAKSSSGTGFLISAKGHIATNNHVISGCREITGQIAGNSVPLKILASDPTNDLALLTGDWSNPAHLTLSGRNAKVLDDVVVAGFPFGHSISSAAKYTKGVVSSLSGLGDNFSVFQIDAALQPGNSGGPVIANNGTVVGVAVYKLDMGYMLESFGSLPENMNFAIKTSTLTPMLDAYSVPYAQGTDGGHVDPDIIDKALVYISCNR